MQPREFHGGGVPDETTGLLDFPVVYRGKSQYTKAKRDKNKESAKRKAAKAARKRNR